MDSDLPIVKGVVLKNTIGHGTFAQVKSAHLRVDSSAIIAIKFVHIPTCQKHGLSEKDVVNEVILQSRCSKHYNVLRVIDCNIAEQYLWIAMEMADGGDLFDKIEPDVGVDSEVAQFYFQQLVSAVSYLHEDCGVAHRDIKPENLLLDKNGNLKLADFGLASKFRRKDGSKRSCCDQRGSAQYMAPEILQQDEYYADMTDIWSIGVFLFVILTGELPWDLPVLEDENFQCFMQNNGKLSIGPWAKIDFTHLNLLRKLLQPDPLKRATLKSIRQHIWFSSKVSFADERLLCKDPAILAERLLSNLKISLADEEFEKFTVTQKDGGSFTQPVKMDTANIESFALPQRHLSQYIDRGSFNMTQHLNQDMAFSQFRSEDLPPDSQWQFNPFKLTKFYTMEEMEFVLLTLEKALQFLNINVKPNLHVRFADLCDDLGYHKAFPLHMNLKTTDRRNGDLYGSISISLIDGDLKCLNFDRKSGDPLEWRRLFKKIVLFCRELVLLPE